MVVSKPSIRECIYVSFPCPCQKGIKPQGEEDQTFGGIKHFTPPSLICHAVGFNLLISVIDSSESVCVYIYNIISYNSVVFPYLN